MIGGELGDIVGHLVAVDGNHIDPDPAVGVERATVLVGPPLILTSAVLACGLAMTILSSLPSLRLFGWLSAFAMVAALTAVVGTVLTFGGAYVVEKCRATGSGLLYLLSVLPVSIPGMVLGLAYIFTFNAAGSVLNALYGTLAILIVSNVIHYFTVGFLTATTALRQMDADVRLGRARGDVPIDVTHVIVILILAQVREIAQTKMPDLNANDIEAAMKIVEGTARSMGVTTD